MYIQLLKHIYILIVDSITDTSHFSLSPYNPPLSPYPPSQVFTTWLNVSMNYAYKHKSFSFSLLITLTLRYFSLFYASLLWGLFCWSIHQNVYINKRKSRLTEKKEYNDLSSYMKNQRKKRISQSKEGKEMPNIKLKQSLWIVPLAIFVEYKPTICQAVGYALCVNNNEQKKQHFPWCLQ